MRILLDTNILIWTLSEPKKLPKEAKRLMDLSSVLYVSAASLWEINIKASLGKIKIDVHQLIRCLHDLDIQELPVTWEHTLLVKDLPFHHHDPFDRILVAQAMSEPLILLTHDAALPQYGELVKFV